MMDIRYQPDALYHAYKTVRLEDKLGEDMTDQKRRIEDKLPTEPLQWDEDSANDEILTLHRQLAAEKLRADRAEGRADAKSQECIELRERMAAGTAVEQPAGDLTNEMALFEMHWPEIHNQGISNGWRGVALAAWKVRASIAAAIASQSQELFNGALEIAVPPEVRRALDRMCTPLDESRLGGATAQEDARCMLVIKSFIDSLAGQSQATKVQAVPEGWTVTAKQHPDGMFYIVSDGRSMRAITEDGEPTMFRYFGSLAAPTAQEVTKQVTPEVVREAVEAAFEERAGWRIKIAAAVRAISAQEVTQQADECAANMNGHSFGPHGRNGERQCRWCAMPVTQQAAPDEAISAIAGELEDAAIPYEGDFADTVRGCVEALRDLIAPTTQQAAKAETAEQAEGAQANVLPPMRGTESQHDATDALLSACREAVVALAHAASDPLYAKAYDAVSSAIEAEVERRCRAQGGGTSKENGSDLAPTTSTVSASDAPLPSEPKPCRQCDDSVGYVCEEHADGEDDAYNHACELMEQFQAERAKRGVEIGTQGSLCDGIAWLYTKLQELEGRSLRTTSPNKGEAA
jgi:hypothetical protein